ncbi:MAG TPA: type II toxin-antitoxin system HicA family toxin [Candidatus Hydrogenedentes bacterium]|nr:type II toxin-antitoxin system HicA family toxin [Candidatus Hydrogenedentota bacterium]HNT87904.1 type II toxin-antitoxin system HicA family toxin [Candidatus Hydrogenedentota bacterium]
MNAQVKKTLEAVFETPTRCDIRWADIESMFVALGAEVQSGRGSRVRVALRGRRAVFHRPHPGRLAKRYQVEYTREFLRGVGVRL